MMIGTTRYGGFGYITSPLVKELLWCPKHGPRLTPIRVCTGIPAGTYHRMSNGKWRVRVRVKKRTNGLTWRLLKPNDPIPNRIRVEMLLLGIQT